MATFDVYELGGDQLGTLTVLDGSWQRRANEPGMGRATINGDVDQTLLSPTTYVRVNDGTRDVAAFFPSTKPRRQVGRGSRVELAGPGLAGLWARALVYPESDCRPVDVRWFGPMSAAYTPDADWNPPYSHGRYDTFPFGEDKGPGFADRRAHLITWDLNLGSTGRLWQHRVEFTLAEDTTVVIQSFGDDWYRTMLDAAPVDELETFEREHNWRGIEEWRGKLCAGDHVLWFEIGQLEEIAPPNPTYICYSVMRAAANGAPQASHHAVSISHAATSGEWQAIVDGRPTDPIAWDATIGEVESAFNDLLGDGEAEVTGSPGAYTVTLNGPTTGYTPHAVGADQGTLNAFVSVQTASYGASAEYIVHSQADQGDVLPPDSGVKGLTAHQIFAAVRDEEMARGDTLVEHLQLTSTTATTDTAGNPLPELVVEVPLDNGTGLRVWELLVEAGMLLDVTPDGVQQIWSSGGRGVDRSATVVYTVGDGATILEAGYDLTGLGNVLRYVTDTGWDEDSDAPSIAVHGRAGQILRLDQYDADAAGQFTAPLLEDLKDPLDPPTLELPGSHALQPGDHYDLGDIITAPGWAVDGFAPTAVRVVELSGRVTGRTHVWNVRGIS